MECIKGNLIGKAKILGDPKEPVFPITLTKYVFEGNKMSQADINKDFRDEDKKLWDAFHQQIVTSGTTTIGDDGYWYVDGVKTDIKAHGEDAPIPLLKPDESGINLIISYDEGKTWYPLIVDFNKLRILGYVESVELLPRSAQIGDIYGVWNPDVYSGRVDEEGHLIKGAYDMYINTVTEWIFDDNITKVYEYETELPQSATDGTVAVVEERDLTLDKEKIDGYKVYKYDLATYGWIMLLNTSEIFATKDDILNHGDNVYALVQGDEPHKYELYKRKVEWVFFGTNASITYHLVQNIEEGTENNILSGKAVKDAIDELAEETDTRLDNLERNTLALIMSAEPNKIFYKDVAEAITIKAELGDLDPDPLDIKINGTKINTGNEKTAVYNEALTNSSTTFTAYAAYYDARFAQSMVLQSRFPVYTIFAAQDADLPSLVPSMTRESARVSAAGTYTFVNNAVDGGSPFLLVPFDVSQPSRFSMGGAPVAAVSFPVTINSVSYTAYRLGSDSGYAIGVRLDIVAS